MPKKLQSTNPPRAFRSLEILALKVQTFHMKISYICTTKIIFISRDNALTLVFKNRLSAAWQLFWLAQSFLQTQEYLSNIDCVMTNNKRDQDSLIRLQLISVLYTCIHPDFGMTWFDGHSFCSNNNIHSLTKTVNEELKNVSDWLKANKLSLNVKKTHRRKYWLEKSYKSCFRCLQQNCKTFWYALSSKTLFTSRCYGGSLLCTYLPTPKLW